MTFRNFILAALPTAALVVAAASPAFAVAIKHTNRVEGDPDRSTIPAVHGARPADSTPAHAFDKTFRDGRSG